MLRYKALWSIPNAGDSVSTFHFVGSLSASDIANVAGAVGEFFDDIKSVLPDEVSVSFDTVVDQLDIDTGELTGSAPVTPLSAVTGGGTGSWAAGAGARIDWLTGAYRFGRQVRGRTFIVPLVGAVFDSNGLVASGTVTGLTTAAQQLIGSSSLNGTPLAVWSRPQAARSDPPTPARPGQLVPATLGVGRSLAATLRGRKY